jgi:LAO/AO transport system kinase
MGRWRPRVVPTIASSREGLEELGRVLDEHHAFLVASGQLASRRADRLRAELAAIVVRYLEMDVHHLAEGGRWTDIGAEVVAGRLNPYDGAKLLLSEIRGH